MKHILSLGLILAAMFMCPVSGSAQRQLSTSELSLYYRQKGHNRVSIHDPSIYYCPADNQYYLQGTHLGSAVSKDMINWSYAPLQFATQNEKGNLTIVDFTQAFFKNMTTSVRRTLNGKTETVKFGNFDAADWRSAYGEALPGNVWAPDVVYNKDMKKWCYYVALNGTWGQSDCVIVMCSGDSPTGPFVYQGPIVYSGFKNGWDPVISWKKTDLEIVLGTLSALPARYDIGDDWGWTWANCIDPTVFYDENGQLWMCYGSFFGGIYILKLDNQTGLRDYTFTYNSDYDVRGAACRTDAYFGYKIAGGLGVTGEGAYIQHFGKYYYLFMTYGSLDIYGGYEMRIFRSDKPEGPYYDYEGVSSVYDWYEVNNGGGATTDRGDKLMGPLNNWGMMTVGEIAQGHCSATIDKEGRYFVIYHTRFNDGVGNVHEVRAHQLFLNENEMLVAAPFEFDGETLTQDSIVSGCQFEKDKIAGEYHVILHPYRLNNSIPEDSRPGKIVLSADGKVSGDFTGSWRMTDGTAFITLNMNGNVYKGVVVEQMVDQTNMKAIAFTTVNAHGVPLWGYKLKEECAVAYNYKNLTIPVKQNQSVSSNLALAQPTTDNVKLVWTSSEPDVISETGRYSPRDTAVNVVLTARLQCGDVFWEEKYNVVAKASNVPSEDFLSGLVAMYDFEGSSLIKNVCDQKQFLSRLSESKGTKPTVEMDAERDGHVLHQYFGFPDGNSTSYARITNPLLNNEELDGVTISMWVKREDDNKWDALWGFWNETTCKGNGPRLFLTGNNYLEFNDDKGNYCQLNYPKEEGYTDIPVGTWALITYAIDREGINVYRNGVKRSRHTFTSSEGNNVSSFDYGRIIDFVKGCKYFYLGNGSFWGSAPAWFDDVMIYNRALTTQQVSALKTVESRYFDWHEATGIDVLLYSPQQVQDKHSLNYQSSVYNLQGMKVNDNYKGIVIINGRKVFRK